jgi:hypothetical protein
VTVARTRLLQAVRDAVAEEMERDPRVIVYGEDVELSIVGDLRGVYERFGPDRIRNTPISETSLTGMAVGLAAAGYRPVVQMMFSNFVYTGMDAIGNQMSKLRLMTGGQVELPITVIATCGGGSSNAAQHSDTSYPVIMNLGGINVAVPATPADAKGLVKTAIRSPNPCFVFEPNGRGGELGEVPGGEHLVPFGKAAVRRDGGDVTVVAIGRAQARARRRRDPGGGGRRRRGARPAHPRAPGRGRDPGVGGENRPPRGRRRGPRVLLGGEPDRRRRRREGVLPAQRPRPAGHDAQRRHPVRPGRRGARDPRRGPHRRCGPAAGRPRREGLRLMRVRVKLPKIGMTMEEATIVRFCRQPGEAFRKGDPLYEIETEKISQEVEATGDGVMVEHAVPEGSEVRVGALVCVVEASGGTG